MTFVDKTVYEFNENNYISRIEDRLGNFVDCVYNETTTWSLLQTASAIA